MYMLVFLYVSTAGLQCISMLPALSSCKVLALVVFCKFLTVFINKKRKKLIKYYTEIGGRSIKLQLLT